MKDDIIPILEQRSKFFCPAKWTELFLYLNHGNSNSCHHPIPHRIPLEGLDKNPAQLHNTPFKLERQQEMIDGIRPKECHMCWHIEDLDSDVVSDRIHKSREYRDQILKLEPSPDHIPTFVELVFDNSCNLMCSYCDSGSSSQWSARVREKPLVLPTESRHLYAKQSIDPTLDTEPYFEAWMKWWPEIQHKIKLLKISGGEPLTSKRCIKFLDSIDSSIDCVVAINSNFSVEQRYIDRIINTSQHFKQFVASVSIDAVGAIAEYTRQNLDYDLLRSNIDYYMSNSGDNCYLNLQSTMNVFNIWGFTDVFDLAIELRQQYGERIAESYSTIVRFPQFQSISILPKDQRDQLAQTITTWFNKRQDQLLERERELVRKTIVYLEQEPEQYYQTNHQLLQRDLKKFVSHYDETSKHKFQNIYPENFVKWLDF